MHHAVTDTVPMMRSLKFLLKLGQRFRSARDKSLNFSSLEEQCYVPRRNEFLSTDGKNSVVCDYGGVWEEGISLYGGTKIFVSSSPSFLKTTYVTSHSQRPPMLRLVVLVTSLVAAVQAQDCKFFPSPFVFVFLLAG